MSEISRSGSASYDPVAAAYAENLYGELALKPLDRHLLSRFAEEVRERGRVADVGCGPGQIARYLRDNGADVFGIDLSPEMVRIAAKLNQDIEFCIGDMRHLDLANASLAGIVAFYSLIHFDAPDLERALREFRRAIRDSGVLLIAFHIGDHTLHVDDMWGQSVSLDFHFLLPDAVVAALESSGFRVTEWTERDPYEGAEHESRRCYLFARPARSGPAA